MKGFSGNFLAAGIKVLQARLFGARTPVTVYLSVTNRCDCDCVYCYCEDEPPRDMTTRELKDLIDQIRASGCETIWLIGGEPLVRNDIIEIARHAKKSGMSVCLASNGHLLEEKQDIIGAIDLLCISLDGPEEMHDANRGAGSFKKAMKAIQTALGRVIISTNTVITKNNIEGIDQVLSIAKGLGLQASFDVARDCPESIRPSNEQYKDAFKRLVAEKRKGAPISQGQTTLQQLSSWPDYGKAVYGKGEHTDATKCLAGKLYCYIDDNGDLYPCPVLVGKIKTLNCLKTGFQKAFDALAAGGAGCGICSSVCFLEQNNIYRLDQGTLLNIIKR